MKRTPSKQNPKNVFDDSKTSLPNNRKKKNDLKKPAPTKASLRRQQIALTKKLEQTSLVPDEALCCVFEYLEISDLLRCCCVNRSWKEVAEIQLLWQKAFRRLPKSCQDLSEKAKTTRQFNWKDECILCLKKRRERMVKKITSSNNLHSGKKKKSEATKALGVRWMVEIQEKGSTRPCQYFSDEDFIFSFYSLNARWNNLVDMVPLSKIKVLSLYGVTPLVFDKMEHPVKNSVYTRSLLFTQHFIENPLKQLKLVQRDEEISLYSLDQLYFGLWSSTMAKKDGDIAFIGFTTPIQNLLLKSLHGNSSTMWRLEEHKVVPDDVDGSYDGLQPLCSPPCWRFTKTAAERFRHYKALSVLHSPVNAQRQDVSGVNPAISILVVFLTSRGCHDYEIRICLRSSRKQYYENTLSFYKNGEWEDDWLCFENISLNNPLYDQFYFDIKDKLQFTWKTLAVNGKMENVVILDVQVTDCNKQTFWEFSGSLSLQKVNDDSDFCNYNVYQINAEEKNRKLSIRVLQDPESYKSTLLSTVVQFHKMSINQWFGTNY